MLGQVSQLSQENFKMSQIRSCIFNVLHPNILDFARLVPYLTAPVYRKILDVEDNLRVGQDALDESCCRGRLLCVQAGRIAPLEALVL